MLDEEEIARFRDNIPCPLLREICVWDEDEAGSARCAVCGSGYMASSRERLRRLYERGTDA